jgi:hypothetical protein
MNNAIPNVFISYSWDSPAHKQWVFQFATKLRENGVNAIIDQWDAAPGTDLVRFMLDNILKSDFILIVCTEEYAKRSMRKSGAVGSESSLITQDIYPFAQNTTIVPILRSGNIESSLPFFLMGRYILDFTDESKFRDNFENLLQLIYKKTTSKKVIDTKKAKFDPNRDQIFVSYSHNDKSWLIQLQTMLKPAIQKENHILWDDTKIDSGKKWKEEIQNALKKAKIAVLLVSPHFLASDFIANNELPPLLDAAETEGISILWIAISSSFYTVTPISEYQALNNPAMPLDMLKPAQRNKQWVSICEKILEHYKRNAH